MNETRTRGRYWLSPYAVLADPTRCRHAVTNWRYFNIDMDKVVECDGRYDVLQCQLCGRTKEVRCTFDEDFS